MAHPWPGNIRQLKNVIANAVILSDGEEISGLEFGDGEAAGEEISIDKDLHTTVARYSRDFEKTDHPLGPGEEQRQHLEERDPPGHQPKDPLREDPPARAGQRSA